MSWVAVGVAGASLVGSVVSSNAAGNAADAQSASAASAQAQQNAQYQQTRSDEAPYTALGTSAIGGINALNSGNYSGFMNSPDYKFALQQGIAGSDGSAAAKGSLYSGGHTMDLTNYASGLASQNLNNYYSHLMGQVGVGQAAASGVAASGQNAANQNQQSSIYSGNAQAQGTVNSANAINNGINQLANGFGQYSSSYGMGGQSSAYGATSPYNTGTAASDVASWQQYNPGSFNLATAGTG